MSILQGDALTVLRTLEAGSVNCCVTSPPYWGLRDYGHDGQLGLEKTPEEYVAKMVEVFGEVRRVLRGDGTLWLNLGDSYWNNFGGGSATVTTGNAEALRQRGRQNKPKSTTYKIKDLVGIPWKVALALQEPIYKCLRCGVPERTSLWPKFKNGLFFACVNCNYRCGNKQPEKEADGWYLRQDIIWHKPNPMPESVTDRCTKAHEYVFLLTKSGRYYFDGEGIKEPVAETSKARQMRGVSSSNKNTNGAPGQTPHSMNQFRNNDKSRQVSELRNKRSVWTVTTKPYKEAHFATFPEALIEPMIMAGCPKGGTVLDPFFGSGTTGAVAKRLGRKSIGIELNPEYIKLAEKRIRNTHGSLL